MFLFGRLRIHGLLSFILLIIFTEVQGQENCPGLLSSAEIQKIEQLILNDKLSEARIKMTSTDSSSLCSYEKILFDITNEKVLPNDKWYRFLVNTFNMPGTERIQFSRFVDQKIEKPKNFEDVNYDYVKIKWLQMMVSADNAATLKQAQNIKADLLQYLDKCKGEPRNMERAKALTQSLQIILYLIQGDLVKGKELSLKTVEIGKKLKDDLLLIVGRYHLSDFLVEERKLSEFIKQSEEVYRMESTLTYPSPYKVKNMVHLIDAYIFQGGNDKRVLELLQQLFNDAKTRPHSFSLYAQFLSKLPEGSPLQKEIFRKFDSDSYVDFSHNIDALSESSLIPNEYYNVLSLTAKMLLNKKEYEEAFSFKDKAIAVNKKIYAEDLSQTLADFQTEKAVQEKEQELQLSRQKSKFYSIIAILVAALFFISLGVLVNNRKKNKSLRQKNGIIKNSLEEKENLLYEKQLLFKEMHHRVKNNFQLLSSLLELQNNDIKDEHALKMAEEGQNRIKSMALIHQRLYEDDSLTISVNEFVNKLVEEISGLSKIKPKCKIDIPDFKFDVDTAIPLGLILNELLTNAFKYGFTAKNPELLISLTQSMDKESYQLSVWDNGEGINVKTSFEKSSSMGLWLVKRLSKQLRGTAEYAYNKGALFIIRFKDTESRMKIA